MSLIQAFLPVIMVFLTGFPQLTASTQVTNLLTNPSFEDGQTVWSGWGNNIQIITGDAHSGNNNARFTGQGTLEQSPVNLEAGKTYKISAWIRINEMDGDDWGGIRFGAIEYNWSEWHMSDFFTPNNRPTGEWFNEILTFTPTTSQVRIQLSFFAGSGWSPDFEFDNIMLFEEVPVNQPPVIDNLALNTQTGEVPFTATGQIQAHDPDGIIQNYIIDTGDGAVYAGSPEFSHTYRIQGNYYLHVTVTDDNGATATETRLIQASGSNDHSINITHPSNGNGSTHHTSYHQIDISGARENGDGEVFWINNRNMQSGFVSTNEGQFAIPGLLLNPGNNKIHVQSQGADGNFVTDEINVYFTPEAYAGPQISSINASRNEVLQNERVDISFNIQTIADHLFFPYDTLAPGNLNTGSGISVDVVFQNGATTLVQPAFLNMEYSQKGNDLLPSGEYRWQARMAFRESGSWQSTIIARDAGGETEIAGPAINVTEEAFNKGYIRVSDHDNRYFEYENGDPFVAMGHGTSVNPPDLTNEEIAQWQNNNLNFGRFWLSSASPFSDPWSSWATHHTMESNGYMPPPLLTHQQKYGQGQFSYRIAAPAIENVNTPAIFRGFWDGKTVVKPNTAYRIMARVKTVDITGTGGLTIKTGGWLGTDAINTGTGQVLTPYMRGNNHWSYLVGTIETGHNQTTLDYIYLVLEDCTGEAYLDQLTIQEISPDGSLKENILPKWNANTHQYLDPIRPKEADYKIDQAHQAGIHYKIVIHEKDDYISNRIDQSGFVSPAHGNFNQTAGTPLHRLYQYYWRNLVARWGYATSVHSWELVNEGAPGSYFDLLNDLSDYFNENSPYPRMVSTSFWSNWEPDYWADSQADYGDFHAYIMTTGWIDNIIIDGQEYSREDLRNDAAAAVYAYSVTAGTDPLRNKPVVWGETDLDMHDNQEPDTLLAQDTSGVWLHNFNWAHINHGGVTALIWDTHNIRNHELYDRYRVFHHFMKGVPLTHGQYGQINAVSSNESIRAWGQVQSSGNAAHLWVQNRGHTWRNVVLNGEPPPESATVSLYDLAPGAHILSRWDPWGSDTIPLAADTVWVDESGILVINVVDLVKDIAFQVEHTGPGDIAGPGYHWPQHQRDAARSGRTTLAVPPPYRARWIWAGPDLTLRNQESEPGWTDDLTSRDGYSFPIPDTLSYTISGSVQPVIYGNRLYFSTMEGGAYALDIHDGTTLWSAQVNGGSIVSAAVAEDVAVFAGVMGTVLAFDTLSGNLQWQYPGGGAITTAPAVIGNSVLIANHRGRVARIHASGEVLWEQQLPAPVVGGIAAHGNSVYVPAEDMVVYALNLDDGSIRASQQVRGQSFRMCHPVVSGGRVWVTSVATPMAGSEYIMEEVMAASATLEDEEDNIRQWLMGNDNNGAWPYASEDWQHFFALDAVTLENLFLIPAGPVDGCGYPTPSPAVDNQGRVLRWWKTRFPFLTAAGPAFGTDYTLDVAGTDPSTGNRIPIDNGQLSGMWPLETDNLYALSVGGPYLWMRQNFRGTQVINLNNSQHVLAQVNIRISDGGNFSHAHICYRQTSIPNDYSEVPYVTTQQRTAGRMAPAIAGNYVFISEEFAIVAIEHNTSKNANDE